MKTILFNTPAGEPIARPLSIRIMPDSAILANRRPFFLPDFDDEWVYSPAIAFRISRLGKSIGTKFASRYFDAITLAVRPIPVTLSKQIEASAPGSDLAYAFDGALLTGDWLPVPEPDTTITGKISGLTLTCTLNSLNIDNAIHSISDYTMLKMGDIIVPAIFPNTAKLTIDSHLEGSLNGEECLSFRIK